VNWDNVLAYTTIKIVKIYDRRLGIIHHVFQLLILVYSIFMLVYLQRYLRTEQPYGSVRSTLREPPTWNNATSLPYCTQNQAYYKTDTGNFTNYPCIYALGNDVTYPPAPMNNMFASTRVKSTTYTLPAKCAGFDALHPNSTDCVPTVSGGGLSMFVVDIEYFTIFLEHAIYGQLNQIATTNNGLAGEFYYKGVDEPEKFDGIRPQGGDVFTLGKMMKAAGIDTLDSPSGLGNSYRYDGLELITIITYKNKPLNPDELFYRYDISVIPAVDSVAFQPSTLVSDTQLTATKRNGIKLIFIIAGTIGLFDWQTLLMNLAGGFVLLKLATTIVDLLMEYAMPDKDKYKEHKYEESDAM